MSSLDQRSELLQRQQAAQGLRRVLELWPNQRRWCQNTFASTNAWGEQMRCLAQALCEGLDIPLIRIVNDQRPEPFRLAAEEVVQVAGLTGDMSLLRALCLINNTTDFDTLRGYVETAATNLERA